jgi:hypothetical protein
LAYDPYLIQPDFYFFNILIKFSSCHQKSPFLSYIKTKLFLGYLLDEFHDILEIQGLGYPSTDEEDDGGEYADVDEELNDLRLDQID